jgi:hypothetical protein
VHIILFFGEVGFVAAGHPNEILALPLIGSDAVYA